MNLTLYKDPEQIKILQDLMQIREVLNRIESPVRGELSRLSEKQYEMYVEYFDMLHAAADNLEELRNAQTDN